jgi:hypothetical protein
MKTKLITLILILAAASAFAHGDIEIGPNGGRILEFSKNESMHGEVTVKEGKFHVAVLDKDMKPVKMEKQSLTATSGTREKPEKLAVEKDATGFIVPLVKEKQWLILQYRETSDAKPITARFEYETKPCGECKKPEWLCACSEEKKK